MTAIQAIQTRRSIRSFTDQAITDQDLQTILHAGMAGPSCANMRDWTFLVVRDQAMLEKIADTNGESAQALKGANLGIMVCGDLTRTFPEAQEYWVIDGAIAAQNMILAAWDLGIGTIMLGTWPEMDRVEAQRALLKIPETHIPHSLIAFGYPTEVLPPRAWKEDKGRVYFEHWGQE